MGLNPDQIKACGTYIDETMGLALKSILGAVKESAIKLCDAWFKACTV